MLVRESSFATITATVTVWQEINSYTTHWIKRRKAGLLSVCQIPSTIRTPMDRPSNYFTPSASKHFHASAPHRLSPFQPLQINKAAHLTILHPTEFSPLDITQGQSISSSKRTEHAPPVFYFYLKAAQKSSPGNRMAIRGSCFWRIHQEMQNNTPCGKYLHRKMPSQKLQIKKDSAHDKKLQPLLESLRFSGTIFLNWRYCHINIFREKHFKTAQIPM